MANAVLEELLVGLREGGGPSFSDSPQVARANFETLLATMPPAEDIALSDIDLGGVPTLRGEAPGADQQKALLYLHGGAYVIGSAKGYSGTSAALGRAAGAVTYSPDYRLAPEHPCPAAVEDAIAAYKGLLDSGLDAANIVLAGDSAGAGLALATMVALKEKGLPQPAAALLISPWVDLACTGASLQSKAAADPILDEDGLKIMAAHYLNGRDAKDPVASPLYADLSGLAPILIQVGSSEVLLDDSVALAGALGAAESPVILEIWPEMFHVWHSFHFMLPEAKAAVDHAGDLLSQKMGK